MALLHTDVWGDPSSPPLVALHGVTGHSRRWERLATERWSDRKVVAVDLRGHGRSTGLPPWSLEQHVADVLEVLDEQAASGPVDVVGHSFGAVVALAAVAARPGLVRRLAMLDPAFLVAPERGADMAAAAIAFEGFDTVQEAIEARNDGLGDAIHPAVPVEVEQHLVPTDDGRFRFRFSVPAAVVIYGEVCRPLPAALAVAPPTLVVGAGRAAFVHDRALAGLAGLLGDALRVEWVDSGHMVYWERFDEVATLVADFLA